jgi:hypothetical protein
VLKRLAIAAVLVTVPLLAGGCVKAGGGPGPSPQLEVLSHEMVKGDSGEVTVLVTVKNVGRVMVELAEVTVNFYDAGKTLIDSSRDSIMNLGTEETWEFEIACEGTRCGEAKSYQVETMAGTSTGGL